MRLKNGPWKLLIFLSQCSKDIPHSRALIGLVVLIGFITGASNTILLVVINSALSGERKSSAGLVWAFAALCLILPASRLLSEVLSVRLITATASTLRMHLSKQILSAPMRLLEELGPHRLLGTLTDDIPTITNALLSIPLLCINTVLLIGSLIYLGFLSVTILVGLIVFLIFAVATYQIPFRKALKYFNRMRQLWDELLGHFRAITYGTKELKLHRQRQEAFFSEQFGVTVESLRHDTFVANVIYAAATSYGQGMIFVLVGLILFGLPAWYPVATKSLSGYTLALLYLMSPVQVILAVIPNLGRANIAIRRLEELSISLKRKPGEDRSAPQPVSPSNLKYLEFDGVTHRYSHENKDDEFLLGPIDLSFRAGELVFIGGGNGSGKTTLVKLFTGIYTPESGEIRFNGRPVNSENLEYYRQHFSAVFSDYYLFDSLLGFDNSELDNRASHYLARLQIDHKVKVNNGVLSTLDLSQGQRKRLALLTAYLEDRPIYIFDEWAADQDPIFKGIFYYQILPELKARGKTVFVVSHDDRYYSAADRLIKLESGKVEYDKAVASAECRAADTYKGLARTE